MLLAAAFVLVELLTISLFAFWVLLPLGQRSADDLAGLMVLSAQTWAELPPQTRPEFEEELLQSHALALRSDALPAAQDEWHPPYFYLLEEALARRCGQKNHLSREQLDTGTWYWASVPVGHRQLAVGVSASRIQSQPVMAFVMALLTGLLCALGVAVGLARQLTRPLAQLEAATWLIGQGGDPALLPDHGPREMVALSRRFNAMAKQVQDLLTARTTLLAGVSHDLRTPLSRMRLVLEMLKDNPNPGLIERLERDIDHINRLIGHVLELARGLEHEKPVKTDMVEFLVELATDFSTPTCPVIVNCPPVHINIAPTALHRAIGNLLQNAQRYAPNLPVDLVVVMEAQMMRIGIFDRGPGIAPEHFEAVFEPFHRLDPSRNPATGGSGLGLSIVRELARANGWQVSLQARDGGGLQAWIALGTESSLNLDTSVLAGVDSRYQCPKSDRLPARASPRL